MDEVTDALLGLVLRQARQMGEIHEVGGPSVIVKFSHITRRDVRMLFIQSFIHL